MKIQFPLLGLLWTAAAMGQPADPSLIGRLCARDAECGCPIPDCEAFFARKGLPAAVVECFVQQPCDALCGPNSGAPGSPLHAACLAVPEPAPSPAARLCARDAECGCPIDDCLAFFAAKNLPDAVLACFAAQSCEALCGPNSGAPGSPLHTACLAGAAPAPPVRASCQTAAQCPGQHDCCNGFCYAMGTALWQTHCMMPDGRF